MRCLKNQIYKSSNFTLSLKKNNSKIFTVHANRWPETKSCIVSKILEHSGKK